MTIMKRRLGVYSTDVPPLIHNHDNLNTTKRRLPRRKALLATDQTSRSPAKRRKSADVDAMIPHLNAKKGYQLRRVSSESNMIEGFDNKEFENKEFENKEFENKESKSTVKQKIVYLESSPTDVIFNSSKKLGEGQISIETYARASFSRRYSEAETPLEKSLVRHTILESIKERGGKLLRESSSESKEGMYYEINDWNAMRKIEDVCAQMYDPSRHSI
eukprot:CAMPEP_0198263622 /NCGR_PEP_ID=MMETSP1447-20131203/12865_1 /TAXON_ID=420782 /ORGANISM="Chaetoceros dichaeta, Strain CCMP1751" /LENGTH=217 /DNA_ID=CAMNT_0043952303 /DNA_START=78 /DNA_END=734 /DNA_ORIENTATION=+